MSESNFEPPTRTFPASSTPFEVCRTCRAFFPTSETDYECLDGLEPTRMKEGYVCTKHRAALFMLCPGHTYRPYAVFRTRAFEEECMRCEGRGEDD